MDEEAQAALARVLLQWLSPEQVVAIRQAVRRSLVVALHEEVGQQFKAQLIPPDRAARRRAMAAPTRSSSSHPCCGGVHEG
jgi:hypothetical protein